jgi:hypothetical protein
LEERFSRFLSDRPPAMLRGDSSFNQKVFMLLELRAENYAVIDNAIAPVSLPLHYFVRAFANAICILLAGLYFVRNPAKIYRLFSFGQEPNRFGVGLFRAMGWAYIIGATIFVLMLFILTILSLIHSH